MYFINTPTAQNFGWHQFECSRLKDKGRTEQHADVRQTEKQKRDDAACDNGAFKVVISMQEITLVKYLSFYKKHTPV